MQIRHCGDGKVVVITRNVHHRTKFENMYDLHHRDANVENKSVVTEYIRRDPLWDLALSRRFAVSRVKAGKNKGKSKFAAYSYFSIYERNLVTYDENGQPVQHDTTEQEVYHSATHDNNWLNDVTNQKIVIGSLQESK